MSGIFNTEIFAKLKEETSFKTNNFRAITTETAKVYGVRHSFNETTGHVDRQYYPVTKDYSIIRS